MYVKQIQKGNPGILGVTKEKNGYNFAVSIPDGKEASLLLYKKGEETPCEIIPLLQEDRMGTVASVLVNGISPSEWEYNYEIDKEVYQDPYAIVLTGTEEFGCKAEKEQPHKIRCGFGTSNFQWGEESKTVTELSDSVFYKLHVRGFTKQKDSKVREKGTFRGLQKKIPYLKQLGVTGVELMPAYEFVEIEKTKESPHPYHKMEEEPRVNYWGYTSQAYYFAPKAAYAYSKDPVKEMKELIRELHQNQMECIMEFYFTKDISAGQILDVLHHWKLQYHVDGFHLAGENVPQDMLRRDPLLAKTKLFFLSMWDEEKKSASAYKNCGEYNEGFRQDMKRFLKGDEDLLHAFAYRTRRNPSAYATLNYLTVQDGFTLEDSVSYESRHNEANGEDNQDGAEYNYSWNCGVEGPTRKAAVLQLRRQQVKNAVLLLMLSQGTPLWYQGDELSNSQQGNNNAYCQDNEIGWVDWHGSKRSKGLMEFVQSCIAFRKAHPVLHLPTEPRNSDYKSLGYPEMSYHDQRAWAASFENHRHHLGIMYNGQYAKNADGSCDDTIYIAYNMHWNEHEFALPNLPKKQKWYPVMDTSSKDWAGFATEATEPVTDKMIEVPPRTIMVLVGKAGD